jgi:hypothetical protein
MRGFFTADGEENARSDDGWLRVAIDINALTLEAFALLSLKSIFRIRVLDNLIMNDSLALVNVAVMCLCQSDDRHRKTEVATLLFDDCKTLAA